MNQTFLFQTTPAIMNEPGGAARLGEICKERGLTRVFIVTDPGILKAGLLQPALDNMQAGGVQFLVYSDVQADPPEEVVLQAVQAAREFQADGVIGFGGGSSMDTAKLAALLANTDQSLADIYGVGNAGGKRLPLIQIPTTSGTGSEVTPISIVTTGESTKMGVVSPILLPDLALLDADLTLGLPAHITAATGIDAMVHAIEAYTSKIKKNPLSDALALQALELLSRNIRPAVKQGSDRDARANMLLGSMLAGQAFANAPVGAVHALAYPLGGHYHIPHGLSNSLVLPSVLRFNGPAAWELYAQIGPVIFPELRAAAPESIPELLVRGLEELIVDLGLPLTLKEMDIPETDLPMLAQDAMQQERLLMNNPRAVTYEDALAVYQAAYTGKPLAVVK